MSNELGLRNLMFEMDDLQTILDRLAADTTAWSAKSVSRSRSGAWRACAGRRESSWPWPNESTDPPGSKPQASAGLERLSVLNNGGRLWQER